MEDHKIQQWTRGDYSHQNDLKITRSDPDTRLTELEEQLEVAETRCGSLKSQLDYMKMLYQGVQPYSTELIQTVEQTCQVEPKNAAPLSPKEIVETLNVEDKENCHENTNTPVEDVTYYQFLKEIHKMQEISREFELDADFQQTSPRQSLKSQNITPRIIERHTSALDQKEQGNISAECSRTKQIRKTYRLLGSSAETTAKPISILTSLAVTTASLQIPEVCKEHDIDDATTFQHPYGQHSTNYSARLQNDLLTTRDLTSHFISEKETDCGRKRKEGLVDEKRETKKQELVLKLSESMDSAPMIIKRKRIAKVDKKQKSGLCPASILKKTLNSKHEDALSVTSNNKSKRKKGKLRTANSRNTVTTKETNLTDRRDSKKRKQRGYSSATHMSHRFRASNLQHVPCTRAEVVEIYHNNAVEGESGSISVSSSKHSKYETADQLQSRNVLLKKDVPRQMCSAVTYQQQQQPIHQQQDHDSDKVLTFKENNNEGFQKYSSRSQRNQNYAIQDTNGEAVQCSSAPQASRYYDPTVTRNYELPTVASKLKKVNRSYFNRFNFKNIPFVVSTSVSPSHNLGLNIQQVLSIMKTRQPMATGMTPLLIRRISKGIRPVSTFLDNINESSYSPKSLKSTILSKDNNFVPCERPKTTTECTASVNETVKSDYTGCLTTQAGRLNRSVPSTQLPYDAPMQMDPNSDGKNLRNPLLEKEEEEEDEEKQESGCICCTKKSQSYNKTLKQYTSRRSITGNPTLTASTLLKERQEEINIGDNRYNQTENASGNAKGIREVLIKLHDQFEELNIAYEKLQEQAAKSNDKSITKQATALEKELNAKEDEINAVVGLYKEVLQLKQQVNSIHGNNSFVCIATSENPSSPAIIPRTRNMRAQLVTHPMQIFGMRNKGFSVNTREPATATRLTGLLREIQSFQKQLLTL